MKNKYHKFLKEWGYRRINSEPVSDRYPHVFEMDGMFIKVTNDMAEVKVAKLLHEKENDLWAKIISVRHLNGRYVIVSKKLDSLSEEQKTNFNKFMVKMRIVIIIIGFISLVTFKQKNLNIDSFKKYYNDKDNEWLTFARGLIKTLREHGVEYPSDFLTIEDMGIKNGKIASFDINDQKSELFYEKL